MIDNASLLIEELKIKIQKEDPTGTTPYKDAFMLFLQKQEMYDPEDLWEVIDPILKAKLKQECIDNNNFGKDSQFKKQNNLMDFI